MTFRTGAEIVKGALSLITLNHKDNICADRHHYNCVSYTWAAKSTRILECGVKNTCSYFSFGSILSPVQAHKHQHFACTGQQCGSS